MSKHTTGHRELPNYYCDKDFADRYELRRFGPTVPGDPLSFDWQPVTDLLPMVLSDPRVLSGELWFRPVGMKCLAYCVQRRGVGNQPVSADVYRVPTARGGDLTMTTDVESLVGRWEIVEPQKVIAEIEEME